MTKSLKCTLAQSQKAPFKTIRELTSVPASPKVSKKEKKKKKDIWAKHLESATEKMSYSSRIDLAINFNMEVVAVSRRYGVPA
jgi:hypothetical protein